MTRSWATATLVVSSGLTMTISQPRSYSATLEKVECGMIAIGLEAAPLNRLAGSL